MIYQCMMSFNIHDNNNVTQVREKNDIDDTLFLFFKIEKLIFDTVLVIFDRITSENFLKMEILLSRNKIIVIEQIYYFCCQ